MEDRRTNIQIVNDMLQEGKTKEEIIDYIMDLTKGEHPRRLVESAVNRSMEILEERKRFLKKE